MSFSLAQFFNFCDASSDVILRNDVIFSSDQVVCSNQFQIIFTNANEFEKIWIMSRSTRSFLLFFCFFFFCFLLLNLWTKFTYFQFAYFLRMPIYYYSIEWNHIESSVYSSIYNSLECPSALKVSFTHSTAKSYIPFKWK